MQRERRIGAYGLVRDRHERVLLVRARSAESEPAGPWELPGGDVAHGEHPAQAVVRSTSATTGRRTEVIAVRDVLTDIDTPSGDTTAWHHDRIVFELALLDPDSDRRQRRPDPLSVAEWFTLDQLPDLELAPYAAKLLKLAPTDIDQPPVATEEGRPAPAANGNLRRQRFAAYGLVTNPAGDVLLTLISPGYPGAGSWHLPGGGTDFGESAAQGLLREIVEETGQQADIVALISASHRHSAAAFGPEGVPIDMHGVRVVFRATVAVPTQPIVMEENGSTIAAAWYPPAQALRLGLTEIARDCISGELLAPR